MALYDGPTTWCLNDVLIIKFEVVNFTLFRSMVPCTTTAIFMAVTGKRQCLQNLEFIYIVVTVCSDILCAYECKLCVASGLRKYKGGGKMLWIERVYLRQLCK